MGNAEGWVHIRLGFCELCPVEEESIKTICKGTIIMAHVIWRVALGNKGD